MFDTIPDDNLEEVQRRKERKYLPHQELAAIPELIRANRGAAERRNAKDAAINGRNEIFIMWLVTLPWRQRNIRECRIAGPNPNLFKARVSTGVAISKPKWVHEIEATDPNAAFWQFRFGPEETKTGNSLTCILPLRLVSPLENYLTKYRPSLVGDVDPGTLFLNTDGRPLVSSTLNMLVSELTLRFAGRIVTPHVFRDSFAFMWLERFPEDYLTLSKLLWHRNIQTTIKRYGARFNESTALCRMEEKLQ